MGVVEVEVEHNEAVMKHRQFSPETDQHRISLDTVAKKVEMAMEMGMTKMVMKVVECDEAVVKQSSFSPESALHWIFLACFPPNHV